MKRNNLVVLSQKVVDYFFMPCPSSFSWFSWFFSLWPHCQQASCRVASYTHFFLFYLLTAIFSDTDISKTTTNQ